MQAILYYPANYDATKKYPMIVYTYELLSQDRHRYIAPRENDYYNANVFTLSPSSITGRRGSSGCRSHRGRT